MARWASAGPSGSRLLGRSGRSLSGLQLLRHAVLIERQRLHPGDDRAPVVVECLSAVFADQAGICPSIRVTVEAGLDQHRDQGAPLRERGGVAKRPGDPAQERRIYPEPVMIGKSPAANMVGAGPVIEL